MKKLRILSVCLLAVLLLFSACGTALPLETPDSPAERSEQFHAGENRETPDEAAGSPQQAHAGENKDAQESGTVPGGAGAPSDAQAPPGEPGERLPAYGGYYYDLTNVVLYLEAYGELPPNYITKNAARALGWEGGSVEKYKEGAAIGGDFFGNYEGLLPDGSGQRYTECDIDTNGYPSRGSRRLVFSGDGRYFYTSDHYESFSEYEVTADYEVIPCE